MQKIFSVIVLLCIVSLHAMEDSRVIEDDRVTELSHYIASINSLSPSEQATFGIYAQRPVSSEDTHFLTTKKDDPDVAHKKFYEKIIVGCQKSNACLHTELCHTAMLGMLSGTLVYALCHTGLIVIAPCFGCDANIIMCRPDFIGTSIGFSGVGCVSPFFCCDLRKACCDDTW